MPDNRWIGSLVGRLHNAKITYEELGREAQMTKSYVSMILNGHRNPKEAKERLNAAYERIMARRRAERAS